jgi:hypothetical protein
MNVMIIPEDFRHDEAVLLPIVKQMFRWLNRRAIVRVCHEPRMRGVIKALQTETIEDVINRYPMVDLFLLVVDRDGDCNRRAQLTTLEQHAAGIFGTKPRRLLAVNAWQKLEVWVLAAMTDLPKSWKWKDIRSHRDPKETYFEPYAKQRGLSDRLYGGRVALGAEAAANYKRIRSKCPEVKALEERL